MSVNSVIDKQLLA